MVDGAPTRIQLSRRAGWRKPEGAIVVARPGPWGNHHVVSHEAGFWIVTDRLTDFTIGRYDDHRGALLHAVARFEEDLVQGAMRYTVTDVRCALRGKDLCCWCALDGPCHADVLLEWANITR